MLQHVVIITIRTYTQNWVVADHVESQLIGLNAAGHIAVFIIGFGVEDGRNAIEIGAWSLITKTRAIRMRIRICFFPYIPKDNQANTKPLSR